MYRDYLSATFQYKKEHQNSFIVHIPYINDVLLGENFQ
ncbi:MAG: hypothetical protein ACI9N3_001730 [Colwellia sp.]|jgi:hypothetical protein